MKKILTTFITLICISFSVNSKTVYVTDNMKYTLRSSENNRSRILKMLPSGTALKLLSESSATFYSRVRTESGTEGFILTRHTLNNPISRWYLDEANKKLEALQKEFDIANKELALLKGNNNQTLSSNQTISLERDKLSKELTDLQQTASNAVQLKHDRDQSRKKIISLSNELKEVSHENQMLKDSANQDWFLYGGLLALFGVILGFILPKLSWHRKTSNWDTF